MLRLSESDMHIVALRRMLAKDITRQEMCAFDFGVLVREKSALHPQNGMKC